VARRLDYWAKAETFAWLDEREEAIFDRYLAIGAVDRLVEELGAQLKAESSGGLSGHTFYAWLEAEPERWQNWERAKKVRGHYSADRAMAEAEAATQQDANARRLKYEAHMRAAEWQNREVFGKRPEVQIALGVGGEWAQALSIALQSGDDRLAIGPAKQDSLDRPERSDPDTEQAIARASGGMEVQSSGMPSHAQGTPSHD